MRHNAALHFTYHDSDGRQSFNIFLPSCGTPDEIKLNVKRAIRDRRTILSTDPELAVVNIMRQIGKRQAFHIRQRERSYLWRYEFHLSRIPPRVNIINASNGLSEKHNLFAWLGNVRRISEKPTLKEKQPHYGKRGRPTVLSKYYVPAPDHITPEGEVVYHNKRAKNNLQSSPNYAPVH